VTAPAADFQGTVLLQINAYRSKPSKVLVPSCPVDGKQCSVIVTLKDGIDGRKLVQHYVAEVTHLSAVGQAILNFGKNRTIDCCKAFNELQHAEGVKIVEFDAPVHSFDKLADGDLVPLHDSEHDETNNPSDGKDGHKIAEPSDGKDVKIATSCPADGKKCTILVTLSQGYQNILSKVAKSDGFKDAVVDTLGSITVIQFGKHQAEECCSAYKLLSSTSGVTSVEFDMPVFAIDNIRDEAPAHPFGDEVPAAPKSGVKGHCLWLGLSWILMHVFNAF